MESTGYWELPETAQCSYSSEHCTGVGTLRLDPYDADIKNRKIMRYLCDNCTDAIALEI